MIINSQKIIFVHVPKTAGTSITHFLKKYYHELNIPEHLILYIKALKKAGYSEDNIKRITTNKRYQRKIMNYKFSKHSTALQYQKLYGQKIFNSYYKFSFVRNPWDRMLSWYINPKDGQPFKENDFYNWLKTKENDSQLKYIKIDNKITVDLIGRFETLHDDLKKVFKKLTIPAKELDNLPHLNKSVREKYQKYYKNESRKLVSEMFAEEIELFTYSYN